MQTIQSYTQQLLTVICNIKLLCNLKMVINTSPSKLRQTKSSDQNLTASQLVFCLRNDQHFYIFINYIYLYLLTFSFRIFLAFLSNFLAVIGKEQEKLGRKMGKESRKWSEAAYGSPAHLSEQQLHPSWSNLNRIAHQLTKLTN